MEMRSRFIKLYDDNGYGYIVNIDKITFVNVDGRKVWADGKTELDICGKSMDYLCRKLVGDC